MIGLVSCSAQKLDHAAPARELYISSLFRASLAYVEKRCERVYILSAKHGLVKLDQRVEPYNVTLSRMPIKDRVIWGYRTVVQLVGEEGGLPMDAIIMAGREYVDPITQALRPLRWRLQDPMHGMQIGQRLSFLARSHSSDARDRRAT